MRAGKRLFFSFPLFCVGSLGHKVLAHTVLSEEEEEGKKCSYVQHYC